MTVTWMNKCYSSGETQTAYEICAETHGKRGVMGIDNHGIDMGKLNKALEIAKDLNIGITFTAEETRKLCGELFGWKKMVETLLNGCTWISVEDRLPEKSGKYLVLSGMNNDPAIEHFDGFNWFALGGSVNWWMEIPKPPERSE